MKPLGGKSVRWLIALTTVLGSVYLFLAFFGFPYNCITMTLRKMSGPSGFDFEVSETACSTLGNDASISVFASKAGQTQKMLLLKYGPALDPMPAIAEVDQHTVKVSISRISDLMFRRDSWEGLTIIYDIGSIDFPTNGTRTY